MQAASLNNGDFSPGLRPAGRHPHEVRRLEAAMVMALALTVHGYDLEPEAGLSTAGGEQLTLRPEGLRMRVKLRAQARSL